MKKILVLPLNMMILLASCVQMKSTVDSQEAINSLIETEKNFAELSKSTSTKNAFLTNLHDEGILLKPHAVNGKEFWAENEDQGELLYWEPEYAGVSSGGDLGFTTGPFYFKQSRQQDSILFYGHYCSVWGIVDSNWKLLFDLGVGHEPVKFPESVETVVLENKYDPSGTDMIDQEYKFISNFKSNGLSSYSNYISENTRFLRPSKIPITTPNEVEKLLIETDIAFEYTFQDGAISSSGDLGYTYGKVMLDLKSKGRKLEMNYLRIWNNTDKGWKILVDVVGG